MTSLLTLSNKRYTNTIEVQISLKRSKYTKVKRNKKPVDLLYLYILYYWYKRLLL